MKNDEKTPDTTQTETFFSPFVPTVNIVGFNYEFISYSFFFFKSRQVTCLYMKGTNVERCLERGAPQSNNWKIKDRPLKNPALIFCSVKGGGFS